jgi:hypothetical protein
MKVKWDDYSQLNGKIKHVPNHQAAYLSNFSGIHRTVQAVQLTFASWKSWVPFPPMA